MALAQLQKTPSQLLAAVVFLALIQAGATIRWSGPLQNDSTVVPACVGDNVSLGWRFFASRTEVVRDIDWSSLTKRTPTKELLAVYRSDQFLPKEAFLDRVAFEPNAGLVLNAVTLTDAGRYTVEVDVHDSAAKFSNHMRSITLDVADFFRVTREPKPQYNESSESWHIVLKCGLFSTLDHPTGVVWETPKGEMASTSYRDGYLYLQVQNPVAGGNYTCRLPPDSPPQACVGGEDSSEREAVYSVDETDARLALLEIENIKRREAYEKRMKELETRMNVLLASLNFVPHVAFHARLGSNTRYNSGTIVKLNKVITNIGDAYDPSTGQFTVPYNGTYFLAASSGDAGSSSSDFANLNLEVDGSWVCFIRDQYDGHHSTSTCHVVMYLKAGQVVRLKNVSNNYLYGDLTAMSGFLISHG